MFPIAKPTSCLNFESDESELGSESDDAVVVPTGLQVYEASEIDMTCQRIIESMSDRIRPKHLFKNYRNRFDEKVLAEMDDALKQSRFEYDDRAPRLAIKNKERTNHMC